MNIDDIYINDPNIWLSTDSNGDTIMPEQAKDQIYKAVMEVLAIDKTSTEYKIAKEQHLVKWGKGNETSLSNDLDLFTDWILLEQTANINKFFGKDK